MKSLEVPCPTCKKIISWDNHHPDKPFCSERCKLIDLGAWANEEHCISDDPTSPIKRHSDSE